MSGMAMMIERNDRESMSPISFRGTSVDERLMVDLAALLGCTKTATPRIALRILALLLHDERLMEIGYRVHRRTVLRRNTLQEEIHG